MSLNLIILRFPSGQTFFGEDLYTMMQGMWPYTLSCKSCLNESRQPFSDALFNYSRGQTFQLGGQHLHRVKRLYVSLESVLRRSR